MHLKTVLANAKEMFASHEMYANMQALLDRVLLAEAALQQ